MEVLKLAKIKISINLYFKRSGLQNDKMLLTTSWAVDLLLLFGALTFLLYKYVTRKFDYWKKRGVYNPKPLPFIGNFAELTAFKTSAGEWMKKLYDSIDEPYFGIFVFDEPFLVIKNPELVKNILVKDFEYFTDRLVAAPSHNDLVANMMFTQKSPRWKSVRNKMTPAFTSGKLKGMFPLMNKVGNDLVRYIKCHEGNLEAKELCSKYSTDVIAICAFGIAAHSLDDEDAIFRQLGRTIFEFSWRNALTQTMYFFRPNWVDTFKLEFIERWVLEYFRTTFTNVVNEREKNSMRANDFVDILLDLKKHEESTKDLNFEGDVVIAQAVQFFVAGFETTSSTISYALHELALHPQIQNKLRNEILCNIRTFGGITYEGVNELKYLDRCIQETLRKYPVLPFLDRVCNANYKVPESNLVIEKGVPVLIPMFGLHYDEKYFPEPDKYNPDRYLEKIHNSYGLVHIPFGSGPRNCIGERFGLLSTKMAIMHILSQFDVKPTTNTPNPIEFEPKSFMLQSKIGIPLNFKAIVPSPA